MTRPTPAEVIEGALAEFFKYPTKEAQAYWVIRDLDDAGYQIVETNAEYIHVERSRWEELQARNPPLIAPESDEQGTERPETPETLFGFPVRTDESLPPRVVAMTSATKAEMQRFLNRLNGQTPSPFPPPPPTKTTAEALGELRARLEKLREDIQHQVEITDPRFTLHARYDGYHSGVARHSRPPQGVRAVSAMDKTQHIDRAQSALIRAALFLTQEQAWDLAFALAAEGLLLTDEQAEALDYNALAAAVTLTPAGHVFVLGWFISHDPDAVIKAINAAKDYEWAIKS